MDFASPSSGVGIRVGGMAHVGWWPPVVYGQRRVTIRGGKTDFACPSSGVGIRVGGTAHVGWWPPVVYGQRRVTIRGVTRTCTGDQCEWLSGASS
jgi:hypothetical protein